MKRNMISIAISVLMAVVLLHLGGCKPKQAAIPQADPRFIPHIAAYTTGIISSASTIKIRLAEPAATFAGENRPAVEPLFEFSPALKGETYWIDRQTVEFKPAESMKQDQVYQATFALGKVKEVESSLREFEFGFQIMKQSFEVESGGLVIENTSNPNSYTFEGRVLTMDVMDPEKVKNILQATYQGKELTISRTSGSDRHIHAFSVSGIDRQRASTALKISWDGKPVAVDVKGDREIPVPAQGAFVKMSERIEPGAQRSLYLYFSDPLDPRQDIRGLVTTNVDEMTSYLIQSNTLKIFFSDAFEQELTVTVNAGLLNLSGKKLSQEYIIRQPAGSFASLKPQIRAVGAGNILPSSQGLVFPFEAVNLKAVKLTIFKIFENNIGQFLQENQLSGYGDMKRVSLPVFSKTIPLTNSGVTDFSRWNRFTFDLSQFIQADPGAIYQISITFNKRHILYPCENSEEESDASTDQEDLERLEKLFNSPEGYYSPYWSEDYYTEDYDWSQRDNPCNGAYYSQDKMLRQNLLATDIGLIAKRGNSGDILVAACDIPTAKPMNGVDLSVLDYQLQEMTRATSDKDGFATFRLDRKPFLLIAKKGNQRSYLRLDDGSALSLSNFDISGEEIQQGLKGFIYGERGVWRPGDTLFVSFILEDREQILPLGHPIVFELRNPQGQLTSRKVKTYDKKGIYTFITATSSDAPTGKWNVSVKTGGTVFTKALRIETVKPNRLKITFQPDKAVVFGNTGKIRANLHAQWLHGGKAANLKTGYEVMLTKARAEFKSYRNFIFDDPGITFYPQTLPLFDGRLDEEGYVTIDKNLGLSTTLPSALNAYFRGKVFEPGGDFSVDFLTEPVLPYPVYVGMKAEMPREGYWLEADKDHTVSIVTIDRMGNLVAGRDLQAEIFKVDWSWWWNEDDAGSAEYAVSSYQRPIYSTVFSTSGGKGSFQYKIPYPEWGRFYVRVKNPETGQTCGQYIYIDWPDSYGRRGGDMPGGATMLPLSADKSGCKVGESVNVTIPGMAGARALVSIENGSRVVKSFWTDAGSSENVVKIEAMATMTPNVYIHITLIQPHKDKKNDLPIRQYGILPLEVEDPGTHLMPVIRMADVLKPEQKVGITVSEKNGKPITYTIAVVDEGLLDLTRFKTPDPHALFYAHEGLGVKSFDLYEGVIGAFGGTLERLLSIGGDEEMKQEEKGKSLRFKPVVKFLGPFSIKAGEKVTHSFLMPNYIGSVRTMVVAAGEGAYGMAEKTTPVKQDLMVMATLPRVLGPKEEIIVPVNVFVMNRAVKSVTVSIKSNKLLTLEGSSTQTIAFSGEGEKMIFFRFKAGSSLGEAHIECKATGNGITSVYTTDLPIRSPHVPVQKSTDYQVNQGETKTLAFTPFGLSGTNQASLVLSAVEKIDFNQLIKYLVQYPYGCAEQTTSGAFAQLYLSKVVNLPEEVRKRTEDNIRTGITRLGKMQATDGGFIYWPGGRDIDDWTSSYAGHFLLEAIALGYSVPDHMINRWKDYQCAAVRRWAADPKVSWPGLVQAYRLYTLALAGSPDMGSMNRMREVVNLSPQASWRLAAAYALAGKREIAANMTRNLPVQFQHDNEGYYTYGSQLRDQAMALETMITLGNAAEAGKLAKNIASKINSADWLSTQESAFSLMALAKYYSEFVKSNGIKSLVTINGQQSRAETNLFQLEFPVKVVDQKSNSITVVNQSTGVMFLTLTESGIPVETDDISFRNNLSMVVKFADKDGKNLDITKLPQGKDFTISIAVRSQNPDGCRNLALVQVFPSGWEIGNTRVAEDVDSHGSQQFKYQDFRDDRVNTFFDLYGTREKTFIFEVTATYPGKFYLPGSYCEAMYDHTVNARDKGMWIEVVRE